MPLQREKKKLKLSPFLDNLTSCILTLATILSKRLLHEITNCLATPLYCHTRTGACNHVLLAKFNLNALSKRTITTPSNTKLLFFPHCTTQNATASNF